MPPGYLFNSIKMRTSVRKKEGLVRVTFGVLSEAFYGINFLDDHKITVNSRRGKIGRRPIKPYELPRFYWFRPVFILNRNRIETTFREELRNRLREIAHG